MKSVDNISAKQWTELTDTGYTITSIELSKEHLSTIRSDLKKWTSGTSDGRAVSVGRIHYELVDNKIFVDSEQVRRLLSTFEPYCRKYFGPRYSDIRLSTVQLVVSSPGSYDQCWHADNADRGLTFVIPLVDITKENGTTQLIAGSHKLKSVRNLGIKSPLLSRTDLLIMDARLLHRGSRNVCTNVRPILVFRYDDVKTPAPGSGYLGALARDAIGSILFSFFSQ
jgi:hypothetical protein